MERLVVVGGDAAGMSAASQARRLRGSDDLEILAFERGRYTSYSACGLPYFVAGLIEHEDALITRRPEVFRERQDIDVHIRHEVRSIDLGNRRVEVEDLETGRTRSEAFDQLMLGTGSTPKRPPLDGIDAPNVMGVRAIPDALAIRRILEDQRPTSVVVLGGGYIGLEMAEAFVTRGVETSVVEMLPQPMSTLDPDMGARVADAMRAAGIALYLEERAEGFDLADGRVRALQTSERTLPADLVILGLGVRPETDLARAAGIPIGDRTGGIVTDERMATPLEGVWAAGDCAQTTHRITGEGVVIALGTHANKQGRVAGTNIGGGSATFPGVIGTAASKICAVEIARTGLGEREAAEAGFAPSATTTRSTTRSGYFPGTEEIHTKIVTDRATGRLLGAQIVGGTGAAKRIDVLATAIWNEMRADDFALVDLSYAPPFSPVLDPVSIAARRAAEELSR